jgi:hypothetical protein
MMSTVEASLKSIAIQEKAAAACADAVREARQALRGAHDQAHVRRRKAARSLARL